MPRRFASLLLLPALAGAPAAAQVQPLPPGSIPEVTFAVTPLLDGPCARITDQPPDTAAARELRARVGEFRAIWAASGPSLLRAAVEATGHPFRFRETMAALHTCPAFDNLSLPLSFSVRRYLRAAPAGEKADSLHAFAAVVFHEVLHRHVVDLLGEAHATPLTARFAGESGMVRFHLHLMAIEDSAYRRLGWTRQLASVRAEYARYPSYVRARRIVDSVGVEPFLAELRAAPGLPDTVTFASGGSSIPRSAPACRRGTASASGATSSGRRTCSRSWRSTWNPRRADAPGLRCQESDGCRVVRASRCFSDPPIPPVP